MSKFSLSLGKKLVYKLYKKRDGLVQIPLIIGLVVMAVALPLVTKLTQQNTENRSKAYDGCSGAPQQACQYMSNCTWNGSSCTSIKTCASCNGNTRCSGDVVTVCNCDGNWVGNTPCASGTHCDSSGTHCVASAPAATATPRPSDCRTSGCPSGQTCTSDVGIWDCVPNPTATPRPASTGDCRTSGCARGTCTNINYMAGREGSPAVYVCVTPTPVPPTATPRPYNCPSRCSSNKGCATVTYQSTDSACNNVISGTQNYTPNCSCGPVSGGDNSICQQTGCKKPNGESCSTGSDCASAICFSGKCSAADCSGGYGNKPNSCSCTYSFECDSGNCVSGKCVASGSSNPTSIPTQATQHYTVYKNGSCQTSANAYVSLTACNNDPPVNNCYSSMAACNSAHPATPTQHYTVYKNGSCQTSINEYTSLTACNNDPPVNNCYSSMAACNSAHPVASVPTYTCETNGDHCYTTQVNGSIPTSCLTYTNTYKQLYGSGSGTCASGLCCKTPVACTCSSGYSTSVTSCPSGSTLDTTNSLSCGSGVKCGKCITATSTTDPECVGHANSTGFCSGTTYLRCEAGKVAYTLANAAACPVTPTDACNNYGSSIPTCMSQSNCTWNGTACVTKPVCDKLCGSNKYGDIVCSGNAVKICQCDGTWSSTVPCASGLVCDSTATKCVAPATADPGITFSNFNVVANSSTSVRVTGSMTATNGGLLQMYWFKVDGNDIQKLTLQNPDGNGGFVGRTSYDFTNISVNNLSTGNHNVAVCGTVKSTDGSKEVNACTDVKAVSLVNPPTAAPGRCDVCSTFATSRNNGDFDCNGTSNLTDFSVWKDLYFNCSGVVSTNDFSIWKEKYLINK